MVTWRWTGWGQLPPRPGILLHQPRPRHDVQPSPRQTQCQPCSPASSFGRNVPGKTDPMDGVEGIAEKGSEMFQYYKDSSDRSPGWTGPPLSPTSSALPDTQRWYRWWWEIRDAWCILLNELAPAYGEIVKRRIFGHFASTCAIIGVFTVSWNPGQIDLQLARILQKKAELGKAG